MSKAVLYIKSFINGISSSVEDLRGAALALRLHMKGMLALYNFYLHTTGRRVHYSSEWGPHGGRMPPLGNDS